MPDKEQDTFEIILCYIKDIAVLLLTTIINCLEESFNCMSYAGGSNLKYVVYMCASFIPVTILFPLIGISTMIPWQDALIATTFMITMYGINNITRKSIDNSIFKVMGAIKRFKEGRIDKDAGQ